MAASSVTICAAAQAEPTACQTRLASGLAAFKSLGDIAGPPDGSAGCGGQDIVLLQWILLPDHAAVAVEPPATLRCEMAEDVAGWVRDDLAPAAASMGAPLIAVENEDSYTCRGRNGAAGARLSEHGLANALDIGAIRLRDGRVLRPADAGASHEFRAAMKAAACRRFTTVLGPGADAHHEDHIHLDRIERRNGYRICQWEVRDEPRLALQSVSSTPAARNDVPSGAAAAALHAPVPLPRPRPIPLQAATAKAATDRVVTPPAERRHR